MTTATLGYVFRKPILEFLLMPVLYVFSSRSHDSVGPGTYDCVSNFWEPDIDKTIPGDPICRGISYIINIQVIK
jgi:hypothetical protein